MDRCIIIFIEVVHNCEFGCKPLFLLSISGEIVAYQFLSPSFPFPLLSPPFLPRLLVLFLILLFLLYPSLPRLLVLFLPFYLLSFYPLFKFFPPILPPPTCTSPTPEKEAHLLLLPADEVVPFKTRTWPLLLACPYFISNSTSVVSISGSLFFRVLVMARRPATTFR
jgi:hypothetical protein